MRSTIRQVARLAGVSAKTVSNVLRGLTGETSSETRARVIKAARQLRYVPVQPGIPQNRRIETRIISMHFDEGDPVQHRLGMETLSGMRTGAIEHGYDLLMSLRPLPEWLIGREEAMVLDKRCDAYVFVLPARREKLLAALAAGGVPAVSCYSTDVPAGVGWVIPDNAAAMRLAVDRLVAAGHRRICHLGGSREQSDARERAAGYIAAMEHAGLKGAADRVVLGSWTPGEQNLAACDRILAMKPTAVVCANDFLALRLLERCAERGIDVPGKLSVIGMDDVREAAEHDLTTVKNPFTAIGRAAVAAATAMIQGVPAADVRQRIPVALVERATVRAL